MPEAPVRALALLSGGLDSALAARIVQREGVEVVGLHFRSPTACRADVAGVARDLGVPLEIRDKGEAYVRLLREPRHGYGRNMNPCVDCRAFMFRRACALLPELGARFVVTGEVLGQRPMSQTRNAIGIIDRASDVGALVLRPLSARLLPPSLAETSGWVRRERLHAISGRGRHEQLALAESLGVRRYESPGGGCLLTDPGFSARLRDYFAHTPADQADVEGVALLRVGRHVRVSSGLSLIVGRREEENARLAAAVSRGRWLLEPVDFAGPSVLVCGPRDGAALARAVGELVRHAPAARPGGRLRVRSADGERTLRLVAGAPDGGLGLAPGPVAGSAPGGRRAREALKSARKRAEPEGSRGNPR